MVLGAPVDGALPHHFRWLLEQRQRLLADQITDYYRDCWHTALEEEGSKLGVHWGGLDEPSAFELDRQAIALAFEQLVPKIGHPRRAAGCD
ncbi:MAG: hypothetical protein ACLP50_14480 [Solirubrobacteraceae bacterium]